MKKTLSLFLVCLMSVLAFSMSGCLSKEQKSQRALGEAFGIPDVTLADEVYVYTGPINESNLIEREMLSALQGAVARNTGKSALYLNVSPYEKYLPALKENFPEVTFYERTNLRSLYDIFSASVTEQGYILYKTGTYSRNNAVTAAAATGYIICDESKKGELDALGYTQKLDVRAMSQETCFNTYKDSLNNKYVFHLYPSWDGNIDFAIQNKGYTFATEDEAYEGSPGTLFFNKVMDWAEDNNIVFCTGGNIKEDTYTSMVTVNNMFNLPSEWAQNLSILPALKKDTAPKLKDTVVKPKEGKHYMAFYLSDGDNIQVQMHDMPYSSKYFGSSYRGEFPMTWGISPMLADFCSPVLDYYYNNMTSVDGFVCGPSGVGYAHPSNFPNIDFFASATNKYMGRTGLRYVNLIDMLDPDGTQYLKSFADMPNIDGGFYSTGYKYAGGGHSVYWYDGKPFVTIADALWDEVSVNQSVAHLKETAQVKDYTSIEGYSIVAVHAWSADMFMIRNIVERLGNDIELVTVNQLMDMVKQNVPKTNVTAE